MSQQQYLEAGRSHTNKDEEMSWAKIRIPKNHVNSHMWWLSKICSYARYTHGERMLNNLTVAGIDLQEMSLLVKDYKQ